MPAPTAFTRHDHSRCSNRAVARVRRLCQDQGVRLTPQRQTVLELLWRSHHPVGAYALLEMLRKERADTAPLAPPTVYRALDFLVAHGFAHRLETFNAYLGCPRPHHDHQGQFLICTHCNNAVEVFTSDVEHALNQCANAYAFEIQHETVELVGRCAGCRGRSG